MVVRKNITKDENEILKIVAETKVCFLGLSSNDQPYVVPMNFGYQNRVFYFHSGQGGLKLDILQKNPLVSIAIETNSKLHKRNEDVACSFSMTYNSIIASGTAEFIVDIDEKRIAMNIIMKQYTGRDDYIYSDPAIKNVILFKVPVEDITAHIRENK